MSDVEKGSVVCGDCGYSLSAEPTMPCTRCGSTSRNHDVKLTAFLPIASRHCGNGRSGQKISSGGKRRWAWEATFGYSFWRDENTWSYVHRLVDRVSDRYREVVIDPATGGHIKRDESSLKDHHGHGTARSKDGEM